MKALIIHNPAAGQRGRRDEIVSLVDFLVGIGWDISGVEQTRGRGDATTYARQAAASGCDVVFAIGGDGTLSQVADGLIETDTALAVLPAGTGNVMARQLGLPLPGSLRPHSLVDCTRLLLGGSIRKIDVGRVCLAGGTLAYHFLCWGGVGFDAQVNITVNEEPDRKHRLGMLAFVVAALLTLRHFAGTAAVVRVDGRRVTRRLIMLVANNIQLYGAFLKMAPRAILDDGMLDVYCFRGRGAAHTVAHAMRLVLNRHIQDPEVDIYRARRVEIKTARPLPVHVDGEPVGYTPVIMEVLPRALKLLVPVTAPPTIFTQETPQDEVGISWPQTGVLMQPTHRGTHEKEI